MVTNKNKNPWEHRNYYRLTQDQFIDKSQEIHKNKYDYSKVEYKNTRTKVEIICPTHGSFMQTPKKHLMGQGCPLCGKEYSKNWSKNNWEYFKEESAKRFKETYEFPNIIDEYENSHSNITIKCKKCGTSFSKRTSDHITSPYGGCPSCFIRASKNQENLYNFVSNLLGNTPVIYNNRKIISPKEIDIYIPSLKIGIEYNGLFWHNSNRVGKDYHLNKLEECNKKGIRLIEVFEDEYLTKPQIVESKIKHILKKDTDIPSIYGRECKVREISYKEALSFLEDNHIQGHTRSTVYLGCFNKEKLVGVMCFKKEGKYKGKWELTRCATDINYKCIGLCGKMFKDFIDNYKPKEIKSFADRRWTIDIENNLYIKLGFRLDAIQKPDYKYVLFKEYGTRRIHKFNFRKKTLSRKYGLPPTLTEKQMCEEINAYKIYDCGLLKYIWKNGNS